MSCFDKQHYKELKQYAKNDGIVLATRSDSQDNYSGVTVAFQLPAAGLRMVRVAVSYCSPEDEFKPKHGKYQALLKFMSGEFIQLPIGDYDLSTVDEDLLDYFTI